MIPVEVLDAGALEPLARTVGGRGLWRVRLPMRVSIGGAVIEVPPGFLTDGASTPWWARTPFDPWGAHGVPAVVHDYLRGADGVPRWLADLVFLALLRAQGVPAWRAHLMHLVVQLIRPRRAILPENLALERQATIQP